MIHQIMIIQWDLINTMKYLFKASILSVLLLTNIAQGEMASSHFPNPLVAPLSSFQGQLITNSARSRVMQELLLSGPRPSIEDLLGQVQLSYYKNNGFRTKESSLALLKTMDSYSYQSNLKNRRMLVESKFLTTWPKQYHPFVSLGLGQNANGLGTLSELMSANLSSANGANNSLSYLLGLGLEKELIAPKRV